MKILLRKADISVDGLPQFTDINIIGQIRLWMFNTNKPTNYYLLVQDDDLLLSIDTGIDNTDFVDEFNPKIQEIFIKTKTRLDNYGINLQKNFCMDIKVSSDLIEKYKQRVG